MTLWKPVKHKIIGNDEIILQTETGHIVKFKLKSSLLVDLDNNEDGMPYFFMNLGSDYILTKKNNNAMSLEDIGDKYSNVNIIPHGLDYDHIQIGFIYSDGDPNNHKWMINFMDVNNQYKHGYIGTNIKMNCPFTTTSWEDGVWHGRFIVYKKDVIELIENKQGSFILNGSGDIGSHNVNPIEEKIDAVSLRYNINTNMWYCDLKKDEKKVGEIPCKNIICDVPFEGNVDKSSSKPKVTAEIKLKDIKGISMALNALIIKKK